MLRNPYVRTILLSSSLLNLGIWVRNFAILLYVTEITANNAFYVSLISVVEYAPIFLFSFIGGVFADRWSPKRTMILCNMIAGISALSVMLFVELGIWRVLFLVTFLSAVLSQFSQPSAMKLFKQHVKEEELQSVMSMFQTLTAIFTIVGPIIGTFIYQTCGITVSLSVMAGIFGASSLVLMFLPRDINGARKGEQGRFMDEMKASFNYVKSSRPLRTLGITFAFAGLAAGLVQPLNIYVVVDNLGQSREFLKWFLSVNGAAMLVGGGLIMTVAKKTRPQTLLMAGLLVSAVGSFLIGWSKSIPLTLVFVIVNGLFYPAIFVGIQMMILRNTESSFVGRIGGVLTPVFMGMTVIGMALSGVLKEQLNLLAVFAISSILFVIGGLLLVPLLRKEGSRSYSKQLDQS